MSNSQSKITLTLGARVDLKYEPDREAFRTMLLWLHPDPGSAGEMYEEIRRRLIFIFRCRGCLYPDDLADDCIDRVVRLTAATDFSYSGNPALFFYGVAKMIIKEHFRKRTHTEPVSPIHMLEEAEREDQHRCLDKCMSQLSARNQQLILDYYGHNEDSKSVHRKSLADTLGIPLNALRIQVCRIRTMLRNCALRCFESRADKSSL